MKNWKEQLQTSAQDRTLTELWGRERLLVEHHKGIRSYGTDCIRIGTTYGSLTVEGEDLRLCSMSRCQLVIRGTIFSVRTEEGC